MRTLKQSPCLLICCSRTPTYCFNGCAVSNLVCQLPLSALNSTLTSFSEIQEAIKEAGSALTQSRKEHTALTSQIGSPVAQQEAVHRSSFSCGTIVMNLGTAMVCSKRHRHHAVAKMIVGSLRMRVLHDHLGGKLGVTVRDALLLDSCFDHPAHQVILDGWSVSDVHPRSPIIVVEVLTLLGTYYFGGSCFHVSSSVPALAGRNFESTTRPCHPYTRCVQCRNGCTSQSYPECDSSRLWVEADSVEANVE
jgi:hypothetical protein